MDLEAVGVWWQPFVQLDLQFSVRKAAQIQQRAGGHLAMVVGPPDRRGLGFLPPVGLQMRLVSGAPVRAHGPLSFWLGLQPLVVLRLDTLAPDARALTDADLRCAPTGLA